jgi:hypothetical protein
MEWKLMRTTHLVLMPVAFNDGTPIADEVFDRLILELTVKFGGCTFLPTAIGGWIDRDGKFQPDKHRPMAVDVPPERKEELVDWVQRAGKELRQEVMLVMHNFCEASFIEVESGQ